ncbi:MAG: biopolymer transporter ExbD [Magnetococcus sp. WYHC-3]
MHKRPKKKQLTQDAVPTTSLADMMFLLLIFFIMTTTLTRVTGFVTDMPAGSKTQNTQADKNITLGISNGQITIDDKKMTPEEATAYLKSLHLEQRNEEARVVILSSTGKENYQFFFRAMAMVQAAGGIVAIETMEGGK